jgi:ribosomal protein S18 acetylase RimI-like enzyme
MTALVPMSDAAFGQYVADSIPAYARDKAASGQWAEETSLELSRQGFEALLPKGLATPDNYLFELRADGEPNSVGMLWFAVQERAGTKIAYVYDVQIKPAHQRQGHGTRAFSALEVKAREMGLSGIALHVFGHNPEAYALYLRLGFAPTNIQMFKPLGRGSS